MCVISAAFLAGLMHQENSLTHHITQLKQALSCAGYTTSSHAVCNIQPQQRT